MLDPRAERTRELMTRFAERTGLTAGPTRRYLWTDAFAVCNFLALERITGEASYRELALRLVDQVHHTLGRHRRDDSRHGWISGLDDAAGEAHPTRGGLRIGKPLPERAAGAPFDDRLEWERDGQYFHYLTKWMHALDQVARATGQPLFVDWARELAAAGHRGFTYRVSGGVRRMVWKASIDLSRPQVPSMGQHDPLDGFLTGLEVDATAASLGARGPGLAALCTDYAEMIEPGALASADPLGIGGLLVDACRLDGLRAAGVVAADDPLLTALLAAALTGLRHVSRHGDFHRPAHRRLAFRELGLALGLAAIGRLDGGGHAAGRLPRGAAPALAEIATFAALRDDIEAFWLRPAHRRTEPWLEHEDINDVMLATCLAPDGFLGLDPARGVAPSTAAPGRS